MTTAGAWTITAVLARRLLAWVRMTMILLACTLMVFMVLAVATQVASRYLFSFPIAWASETATVAQIWMVLLGAGIAMRQRVHVGIDLVLRHLPRQVAWLLTLGVFMLGIWFFWVVFQGSFRLLQVGAVQRMPALQITMFWAYLVLPVGAAYFALEFTLAMLPQLRGNPLPTAGPTPP